MKEKVLEVEIKRKGIMYSQLARTSTTALYNCHYDILGWKNIWYEAFVIPKNKEYIIAGKTVSAGECFPHDEYFGNGKSKIFFGENALKAAEKWCNSIYNEESQNTNDLC